MKQIFYGVLTLAILQVVFRIPVFKSATDFLSGAQSGQTPPNGNQIIEYFEQWQTQPPQNQQSSIP